MPDFQSFESTAEISGRMAMALVTNIRSHEIRDILIRNEMDRIEPSHWYPMQSMLNVLHDVSEGFNYSEYFVAIGMETAKLRVETLPANALRDSLVDYLGEYGRAYPDFYRNGYVGYISAEAAGSGQLAVHVQTPYPDDLIYGALYTLISHHCEAHGRQFTVTYDGDMRRDNGADETIYHVIIE